VGSTKFARQHAYESELCIFLDTTLGAEFGLHGLTQRFKPTNIHVSRKVFCGRWLCASHNMPDGFTVERTQASLNSTGTHCIARRKAAGHGYI
jgi:hypothetical protein